MHRFLVGEPMAQGMRVTLSEEEAKHALRVLRLKEGDDIELSDGHGGLFAGRIVSAQDECMCLVENALENREAPVQVTLYMGLSKFDKVEFAAQKATELGAARIVPVVMQRSVAKVDAKDAEKKRERMEKICQEATKQCGRAVVPEVYAALSFEKALPMMRSQSLMLVPWEDAKGYRLKDAYEQFPDAKDIGILIGPEGGIDPSEIERLGARSVTLGNRILRTETAAVVSVAMVMQLWGDM